MLFEIGTLPSGSVAGTKVEASISNRNVMGVLLTLGTAVQVDKLTVSVELQSKEGGNQILIPEMPAFPLVELADLRLGVGLGSAITEVAEADTDHSIARVAALLTAFGTVSLTGDDKLIVRVKASSTLTADVVVEGVDAGPLPERIVKVVEKPRGDAVFKDAETVLLYYAGTDANFDAFPTLTAGACRVNTRTPNGEYSFDALSAWDLTRAVGRIESEGTRRTAVVYDDPHGIAPGSSVTVTLSGTSAGSFTLYGLERYADARRAQKSKDALVSTLSSRITALRDTDPDRLSALMAAGRIKVA